MTRTFYLYNQGMDLNLDKPARGALTLLLACSALGSPAFASAPVQDGAELEAYQENKSIEIWRRKCLKFEGVLDPGFQTFEGFWKPTGS